MGRTFMDAQIDRYESVSGHKVHRWHRHQVAASTSQRIMGVYLHLQLFNGIKIIQRSNQMAISNQLDAIKQASHLQLDAESLVYWQLIDRVIC